MHDFVVRHGRVADGTGGPIRVGDVAIDGGIITDFGTVEGRGKRELDADGLLVTPGVIDLHTHYDGQAVWDADLAPSCWHGVTTVVMGNCSVGFAPCASSRRDWLMEMMESVEDIPASTLRMGMDWTWETFPEYLDALDRIPRTIDVGTQLPHAALRAFAMGDRGARDEAPTAHDLARMGVLVEEAIEAGALGLSTSRTVLHHTADRTPIPGTFAGEEELMSLGDALARAGAGVFQVAPPGVAGEDPTRLTAEIEMMERLASRSGRPVCVLLTQNSGTPESWRDVLAAAARAQANGVMLVMQVAGRPGGALAGLGSTLHVLDGCPSFSALRGMATADVVASLRNQAVRQQIMVESTEIPSDGGPGTIPWDHVFPLTAPIDYEPAYEQSVAGLASARGVAPAEVVLDMTIEDPELLFALHVINYAHGNNDDNRTMLAHPASVLGLSDGGAHVATICDASMPTSMLTFWARDRQRGERLPLESVVRMQTYDTATLYGLQDRGLIAPGMLADLNVIDFERLEMRRPVLTHDLPGGAPRLLQRADGYVATIKNGVPVLEDDELTGERPAGVVRGARQSPSPTR